MNVSYLVNEKRERLSGELVDTAVLRESVYSYVCAPLFVPVLKYKLRVSKWNT